MLRPRDSRDCCTSFDSLPEEPGAVVGGVAGNTKALLNDGDLLLLGRTGWDAEVLGLLGGNTKPSASLFGVGGCVGNLTDGCNARTSPAHLRDQHTAKAL